MSETGSNSQGRKQNILLIGQIIITIVIIALLVRGLDGRALIHVIVNLPIWFGIFAVGMIFLLQLIYILKWYYVSADCGAKIPYLNLLEQYFIGMFFSNFLPTTFGGDAAKIYYLGKRSGYISVGAGVLMDRFLGFLSIAILGTALLLILHISTASFQLARNVLLVVSFAFIGLLLVIIFAPLEDFLIRIFTKLPARFASVGDKLTKLITSIRGVRHTPLLVPKVLILVLLYYLGLAVLYKLFLDLAGINATSLLAILAIVLAIGILSNIPLTINGIGLREQLHLLLLGSLGINKEVAVALSLTIFLLMLVTSLVGYGLWLRFKLAERAQNQLSGIPPS